MPFLTNEDGKKKKKMKRNLLSPEQNPQGSLNQTEPEVPFLTNEDGKKKKKRKRNLLALKPRKASSAHVEPLRQGWLPFGGEMTQYSLLAD